MTLIEQTYRELYQAGLVSTREQFSTNYVGKNPNWYSYQTHTGRDFSTNTAIDCLRNIRNSSISPNIEIFQSAALVTAEKILLQLLLERHNVKSVITN